MEKEISATAGEKKKLYVFFSMAMVVNTSPSPCMRLMSPILMTQILISPLPPMKRHDDCLSSRFSNFIAVSRLCLASIWVQNSTFSGDSWMVLNRHPQSILWISPLRHYPCCRSRVQRSPVAVLKQGPPMNTAKLQPVAFVAKRKIFIISGLKHRNMVFNYFAQFEVFDPDTNTWEILPDPPFSGVYAYSHVIVDDTVIFYVSAEKTHFCYDLNTKIWTDFDPPGWTKPRKYSEFTVGRSSVYLDDTLYYCDRSGVMPLKCLKKENCPSEQELVFDSANTIKFLQPTKSVACTLLFPTGWQG